MTLEAFAGRNDFLDDGRIEELHQAVDIIASHLPGPWARQLHELQDLHWQKNEEHGYRFALSRQECDTIIATALSFPHLDEIFIHDREYLKRHKE